MNFWTEFVEDPLKLSLSKGLRASTIDSADTVRHAIMLFLLRTSVRTIPCSFSMSCDTSDPPYGRQQIPETLATRNIRFLRKRLCAPLKDCASFIRRFFTGSWSTPRRKGEWKEGRKHERMRKREGTVNGARGYYTRLL